MQILDAIYHTYRKRAYYLSYCINTNIAASHTIDKIPLMRTITSIIIFLNQLGSFWSGTEIPDDFVVHHEQTCDYDMFPLHVTGQRTQDDETDSDLSDDWIMWRAVLVTRLSRNSSDSCLTFFSGIDIYWAMFVTSMQQMGLKFIQCEILLFLEKKRNNYCSFSVCLTVVEIIASFFRNVFC